MTQDRDIIIILHAYRRAVERW